MAKPTGSTRKLFYPLKDTLDLESVVGSGGVELLSLDGWSTTDPDERIDIVLNLSLNEYVALASSVDVGRDIAYGDNSIFIWWLWVRSLMSMSICDAILACIDDPESGVSQAIYNVISDTTSTQQIESAQGQEDVILGLDNNPSCDFDVLWGGILNLTTQLDANNLDALQILEVATNSAEWATDVVAGVLGIKVPVINSLLEWALFIQDNILENYEAQITVAYMDTITCDLFCLAQINNCALTPEMLVNYFFGRLSSSLTFNSLITESLEFIFLGVWTGTEIADAMMLSQLVFRAQLGSWFRQINFRSIDLDIRLGYDDPSDDWELLCDDCGWESVLDLTISDYGFVFNVDGNDDPTGEWEDGVGLKGSCVFIPSQDQVLLQGHWDFDESQITEWQTFGTYTRGTFTLGSHTALAFVMQLDDVSYSPSLLLKTFTQMGSGTNPLDFDDQFTADTIDEFSIYCRSSRDSCTGVVLLTKVIITGIGTKPPQLP